jgi:flagellar FliJ protein
MSNWSKSLIKLASYEVETLQKRLTEIVDRRAAAEARLIAIETEAAMEAAFAAEDAAAGFYRAGYLQGLKVRKADAQTLIDSCLLEEQGARDALAQAFESQKKYEQVAETALILERKQAGRRETAALDELGLRRAAR